MILGAIYGFIAQSNSKCDDTMYNSMVTAMNGLSLLVGGITLAIQTLFFITYLGSGKLPFIGSAQETKSDTQVAPIQN